MKINQQFQKLKPIWNNKSNNNQYIFGVSYIKKIKI